MRILTGFALAILVALPAPSSAQVRVKDVATLDGYRPTPLLGYGLVVGLNKTGDKRQTIFTAQGFEAIGGTPEEFAVVQAQELTKWKGAVDAAGLRK